MGKEGTVPSYELNSGAMIPCVGLGISAKNETPAEAKAYVLKAIEVGYRHLDTARIYGSEASVGEALQEAFSTGIVKREELFVTTKLWVEDLNPPDVLPALRKSLSMLQLQYLDLYLIHFPVRVRKGAKTWSPEDGDFLAVDLPGSWKVLEEAVERGLTKSIGVSNFSIKRLKEIVSEAKIIPAVNQIELHPGCEQEKVRKYCKEKGIIVTAWSPLGGPGYGTRWGTNAIIDSPILEGIAEKHGKTVAQVALRWILDNDATLVVKSSNPVRMAQNLDLFDWALTPEDHEKIKTVPPHRIWDGSNIAKVPGCPYKWPEDFFDE